MTKRLPAKKERMNRMKIRKGDYGYIKRQKITRFLKTLAFFLLPLAFFVVGLVLNQGDRKSIYTVIAIVGCIPACMSTVNMLMMWMRKPMREDLYKEISGRAGNVLMVYELFLTTQEKNMFLDATAICGEYITAYTDQEVKHKDLEFMEAHILRTLRASHYKATVKIFDSTQKKAFLDRLDTLKNKQAEYEAAANASFKPYEKYPDLSRNEVMKHLLMAIAL